MQRSSGRKPVSNFFIKKSLQIGLIIRVLGAVLGATVMSSAVILVIYLIKHKSISLYQLHDSGVLHKESILVVLLPGLAISLVVNIILAFCLGLYASRKYAVPVYKLEQWARFIKAGKYNTTLRFREKKEMSETVELFNSLTSELRQKLTEVKKMVDESQSGAVDPVLMKKVRDAVADIDLGHTYAISDETQVGNG